jgi:hypothetical protein
MLCDYMTGDEAVRSRENKIKSEISFYKVNIKTDATNVAKRSKLYV